MAAFTKEANLWKNDSRFVAKWVLTDSDRNGDWIEIPIGADRSVHVVFTAGTGTVTIEGSNETGTPAAGVQLKNEQHTTISLTATGIELPLPNTLKVRPVVSGGSSNNISVYLCVNGS